MVRGSHHRLQACGLLAPSPSHSPSVWYPSLQALSLTVSPRRNRTSLHTHTVSSSTAGLSLFLWDVSHDFARGFPKGLYVQNRPQCLVYIERGIGTALGAKGCELWPNGCKFLLLHPFPYNSPKPPPTAPFPVGFKLGSKAKAFRLIVQHYDLTI
ncbi:hypothetical protein F2Q70_00038533 [Brassica cretica]|uniref:Uncharacterized protein n=1 Tax=Brassica cretica TaxID=69181 RepID=A0A8S9MKL6_BRACR|nr:hypothetical protein F2Q70_00038533 [Brassica cretica]KAF2618738.1 hypothetical protein F2Q68_00039171 [Brassica cretica]